MSGLSLASGGTDEANRHDGSAGIQLGVGPGHSARALDFNAVNSG
jgi:hypothetical protein